MRALITNSFNKFLQKNINATDLPTITDDKIKESINILIGLMSQASIHKEKSPKFTYVLLAVVLLSSTELFPSSFCVNILQQLIDYLGFSIEDIIQGTGTLGQYVDPLDDILTTTHEAPKETQ